jgi:hypothetical protein
VARPRGVVLLDEHRRRVAAGELSLAELAAELGVARQSLHAAFKRRSWPTKPAAEGDVAGRRATGTRQEPVRGP